MHNDVLAQSQRLQAEQGPEEHLHDEVKHAAAAAAGGSVLMPCIHMLVGTAVEACCCSGEFEERASYCSWRCHFIDVVASVGGLNGFSVLALMAGQIIQAHHATPFLDG